MLRPRVIFFQHFLRKASWRHYWPVVLLGFGVFVIFLPAFTTEYAFHNDYTLLTIEKWNWFGFVEARHLLLVGRALGAVLISSYCHYLTSIADLAWSRFFSFVGLLVITAILFYRLHKRHGLSVFWASITAFAFCLLPVNQVYVLWVANFIPGTLNTLLSLAAYQLLERSRAENFFYSSGNSSVGYSDLLRAGILFLAALFIYPATAVFIFVLTFMTILFSPLSRWRQVRAVVMRDCIFAVVLMGVYWIGNGYIFRWAMGQGWGRDLPWQHEYQMKVGFPFWQKIDLLGETILTSLSGPWHLFLGNAGAWLTGAFVAGFGLITLLRRPALHTDGRQMETGRFWGGQRFAAGVGLFLLMNLPALAAKGVSALLGYRVILPGMAMFFILQFVLMQKTEQVWRARPLTVGIIRGTAVFLLMMYGLLAAVNVKDAARNYHKELQFLRQALEGFDDRQFNAIVVKQIPAGKTLIHRRMPLEFSFMITSHHHLWAVIKEVAQRKPMAWPAPRLEGADYRLGSKEEDARAYVIDLNEARYY
jgi:hypothetical protein